MSTQPPDPDADKLAASTFDFLLIELVPLAYRVATDLSARETAALQAQAQANGISLSIRPKSSARKSVADATSTAGTGTGIGLGMSYPGADGEEEEEDEEVREAVFWRLETAGYRVGQGLVERFSANTPRPNTPLDMIKFICKDLWQVVFRKQIDNLKTNHRGTFVLTDSRFPPLSRMSPDRRRGPRGPEEAVRRAQAFLWFPCGIVRGALQAFGLEVTVQAESTDLPTAVFQIRTVGSKP